jgi:NSS family neurotransmitter:Na+ symporter
MITYASFLKKKSDLTNNAFIISLADAGTSFLAGFTVFSVVGYLSATQGIGITALGDSIAGPNLTFITYPTAISLLPFAAAFFGVIFFVALLNFGIDSAFSMIEPIAEAAHTKWRLSKAKATGILCILGFALSLMFCFGNGLYLVDIINSVAADFGLVAIGLTECIALGWLYKLYRLRDHANQTSDFKIGRWWDVLIKYVIPFILVIILIVSIINIAILNPPNYPAWIIALIGVLPLAAIIIASYILMKIKTKEEEA